LHLVQNYPQENKGKPVFSNLIFHGMNAVFVLTELYTRGSCDFPSNIVVPSIGCPSKHYGMSMWLQVDTCIYQQMSVTHDFSFWKTCTDGKSYRTRNEGIFLL